VNKYNYDKESKELVVQDNNKNPIEQGKFLISAASTPIKPLPFKEGFAVCFNPNINKWEYIEDNRGLEYVKDKTTNATIYNINYIGEIKENHYLTKFLQKNGRGKFYKKYNKDNTPDIKNQIAIEIHNLNIKIESHFIDIINNGFRYNNYWITCREIDRLELLEIRQTLELIQNKQALKLTKSKISKSIERPYRCYSIEKNIKSKEKEFYKFTILEFDSLYEEGGVFITEQKKKENEIKQKIKTLSLTELENFIL
tara:strand:+ start:178 stop:942 length:765 start_codon:yes stop_codon:yes gene_type:complete